MHSVRLRITLIAAVATAIAVSVASLFVLTRLESSLATEIDASLERQLITFEATVLDYEDLDTASVPLDPDTLFVLVEPSGLVLVSNDSGVDGGEVVGALSIEQDNPGELAFADIALATPTDIADGTTLRAAYVEVFLNDQFDGERFFAVAARSDAAAGRTISGVRNVLLGGVPALVAFVAGLAWWLTGRSLRPVDQMRREVDDISSNDLARRVSEPRSTDEIGQLATTMNRMLGRLEQAKATQDQFVSDAAHELRTPLASMAAQLDVDHAHPDSADHLQTASNIRGEVTRLQSLIDGLLASARGQQTAPHDVRPLVDLDVLAIEASARVARPAAVQLDQSSIGAGTVRGDAAALASLIDNLLANAYRHAKAATAISVGVDRIGVWLAVDDDGTGVDPENRERVFDRFVRLDEARSRDAGGSGLGLALARETAERHGGALWVEESPLGGARFVLRLAEA